MKNASSVEKPTVSDGRLNRVKNFLTNSPSRMRRVMSLGATSTSTQVFGSALSELVAREEGVQNVPFIVRRIVQHIELTGMAEEGLYRINGNSKVIEKLRMSFDKVGDANFSEVDIAAVAGLLKLFLRELSEPVIPEELAPELVLIQRAHPSELTAEALLKMRATLGKFPAINLAVLKHLIEHLARVAEQCENKMTAVSLSIVFGPNLFRCPEGLQGLRMQGYSNSIVCKMIQNHTKLFVSEEVEEDASVKRKRPAPFKPRPYSEHVALKKHKEDSTADASRSLSPPVDTLSVESRERSYSERSIDEAIERSTPSPLPDDVFQDATPTSPRTPTTPEPLVIGNTNEQPPDGGENDSDGNFKRRYGKRGMKFRPKSLENVSPVAKSASDSSMKSKQPRHTQLAIEVSREELLRTPSPYSWQSSPGTSPPTSPSPTLTPGTSRVVDKVIEDSVKQFLFAPPSPPTSSRHDSSVQQHRADVYGLLLPDMALQKWDTTNQQSDDHTTPPNHNAQVDIDPDSTQSHGLEVPAVKRRKGGTDGGKKRRNRKSALFGQDAEASDVTSPIEEMDVQLLSVSGDHVTEGSGHVTVESRVGRVSDLAKQFEKSGVVMGMAAPPFVRVSSDDQEQDTKPARSSTLASSEELTTVTAMLDSRSTVSDEDVFVSPGHLPASSLQQQQQQDSRRQLSTTTSDDVFLSPRRPTLESDEPDTGPASSTLSTAASDGTSHSAFTDFDAVKSTGTLQHITLLRPRGPARAKPRSRAASSPAVTNPAAESSEAVDYHPPSRESGSGRMSEAGPPGKASAREQRRKSTKVSTDSPRRPKKHRYSEPSALPSSQQALPKLGRQPLLDLTSLAPEISKPKSSVKEGWSGETGSSLAPIDGSTDGEIVSAKQLSHRIHELKTVVREFEAEFTAKHCRKPSSSEKGPIKAQLEELTKLRRQFKEMKGRQSDTRLSQTAPPEVTDSTTTHPPKTTAGTTEELSSPRNTRKRSGSRTLSSGPNPKLEGMLAKLMAVLDEKRLRALRPTELSDMSQEQLMAEKQSLQKALLQFEKHNGRPQTKEDKETMRPLYDRYRLVKKLIGSKPQERPSVVSSSSQDQEVLGVTTDSLPSVTLLQSGLAKSLPPQVGTGSHTAQTLSKSATELEYQVSESVLPVAAPGHVTGHVSSQDRTELLDDRQLRDASCEQLVRQKEAALAMKQQLRKVLKEYELAFVNLHGRSVNKEDRKPMQREYKDYKNVKAKMQLIDALIAKKESRR